MRNKMWSSYKSGYYTRDKECGYQTWIRVVIIRDRSGYHTKIDMVIIRDRMWLLYKDRSGYHTGKSGYHTGIMWLLYGNKEWLSYGNKVVIIGG